MDSRLVRVVIVFLQNVSRSGQDVIMAHADDEIT